MANEFICSDCGGDGTRCRCHEKRPYIPYISDEERRQKRIKELEAEVANGLRQLRNSKT